MALPPDYDHDPERWRAWRPPGDVHDVVAPMLRGPVLDVGCGEGRLARALTPGVAWVGVDSSWTQVTEVDAGPVVLADMRALPFEDGVFAEVTHLWCLYHVDDPGSAVAEAHRVLQDGGVYFACTSSRASDPELAWNGYEPTPFDAEEAVAIVSAVFDDVIAEVWDDTLYSLETEADVVAFCRQHSIPEERAHSSALPLWLTKRGVLVRAHKSQPDSPPKCR